MLHKREREIHRTITPAPLPYNIDDRATPARAGLMAAGMVAGSLLAGVGLAITRLGAGAADVGAVAWLCAGGGLAVAGATLFLLALVALVALVWYELQARRVWTQQALWERRQLGGATVTETMRESDLQINDPRHILAAAVAIYWQARYAGQHTPWSVRELRRLEVSTTRRATLVATCGESQARALADMLTAAGIIRGRRERAAGELAVADADELLERLMPALGRLPGVQLVPGEED